jgi:triosephosphate isomerase
MSNGFVAFVVVGVGLSIGMQAISHSEANIEMRTPFCDRCEASAKVTRSCLRHDFDAVVCYGVVLLQTSADQGEDDAIESVSAAIDGR